MAVVMGPCSSRSPMTQDGQSGVRGRRVDQVPGPTAEMLPLPGAWTSASRMQRHGKGPDIPTLRNTGPPRPGLPGHLTRYYRTQVAGEPVKPTVPSEQLG